MKKLLLVLLVLVVVGGGAFAFDASTYPYPINPGDFLISPMVGFGYMSWSGSLGWGWGYGGSLGGGFGLGVPIGLEYALPIPLTVGGEVGVGFGFPSADSLIGVAIPIMAKVAWHPNFEVDNLDLYITLKMGISIGIMGGDATSDFDNKAGVGFAWGTDFGIRYFFTESFGIAGEVGYDRYGIAVRPDSGWPKWLTPIHTFARIGVTIKV